MAWFRKKKFTVLQGPEKKDRIPDGLWHKCDNCLSILYKKDFEERQKVCPKCSHHHKLTAFERIDQIVDPKTFVQDTDNIYPTDALGFVDSKPYTKRLATTQKKTGLRDAVITGTAEINGTPVCLAVMDFRFIGGSMGSVVGEKITRTIERGLSKKLPVIVVCTSGGARMQEGILSLMQMAKTSIAVAQLRQEGIPYITVLTNPTTAGVMASYASLGDVIIAEPRALIGFAGPRVIQQTINQILPKGFQLSEFVREHGFLDIVLERKDLRETLINVLFFFCTNNKALH
jgi:acetyl-CoA carboxylase carboxyl transferase subunit beta